VRAEDVDAEELGRIRRLLDTRIEESDEADA
jgi:hypothetical protein